MSAAARLIRLAVIPLIALFALAVLAGEGTFAGFTPTPLVVNSAADPGDGVCDASCTLRDAILHANADPGLNTIRFDATVFPPDFSGPTIIPATPLPVINGVEITIDGHDAGVEIAGDDLAVGQDVLEVSTASTTAIETVHLNNLVVENSPRYGVNVCAGKSGPNCVNNVLSFGTDHLNVRNNLGTGLRMIATNIDNVEMEEPTAYNNIGDGIHVESIHTTDTVGVSSSTFVPLGSGATPQVLPPANFSNNSGSAIFIKGQTVSGLTIAGNTIQLGDRGIDIDANNLFKDSHINQNSVVQLVDHGISAVSHGSGENVVISNNFVDDVGGDGIHLQVSPFAYTDLNVHDNSSLSSGGYGISFVSRNPGADNVFKANEVSGSGLDGIYLATDLPDGPAPRAQITENSTHGNGQLGIDLEALTDIPPGVTLNDPLDADAGPNSLLNFPVITGATGQQATGTACANCYVEVFASDGDASGYGEGQMFLARDRANGAGEFAVQICATSVLAGSMITATATDGLGETSEFSANFTLTTNADATCIATPTPGGSVTPTPTASPSPTASPVPTGAPATQGDLTCDGEIGGQDALAVLVFAEDLAQPAGGNGDCLAIGQGDPKFGDVTCDDAVDAHDMIAILQYAAGVAIKPPQPNDCTPLGELLPT